MGTTERRTSRPSRSADELVGGAAGALFGTGAVRMAHEEPSLRRFFCNIESDA